MGAIADAKWVYVDGGTEYGWFSDAERAELDSVRTADATYTWRALTADEVASMDAYVTRLYYEQS